MNKSYPKDHKPTTIRLWLQEGKDIGATHLIIMCDDSIQEYYSIKCFSEAHARENVKMKDGQGMQKVVEVYNLSMDWDEQLNQACCRNF